MSATVVTLHPDFVKGEQVEEHIEAARAELGNGGFAAQIGMAPLAVEALKVAVEQINAAIALLETSD